jgi:hypothetical protein
VKDLHIQGFGAPEWIIIQPQISINNKEIMVEQLIVQTVLPYCLGPHKRWNDVL